MRPKAPYHNRTTLPLHGMPRDVREVYKPLLEEENRNYLRRHLFDLSQKASPPRALSKEEIAKLFP